MFEALGKGPKAAVVIRVAARLRKEITKEDRNEKFLMKVDFDEIVAFWSH